jgi:TRAP-type C4-dicarboxylate transport system permease small subunit
MRLAILVLSAVSVAILAALIAVPSAQILMRGVLSLPFIGAEELTRFLLICLVFVSYPLVVEMGDNIVMAEIRHMLPRPVQRAINLAISVSAAVVTIFLAYVAWQTIFKNLNNSTPTLNIPFWIFFAAALFGFGGAAIVHLLHLRKPPQAQRTVSI